MDADGTPGEHLALDAGVQVDVEGPLGSFTFPAAPEERRFVFIAGGTGIAPLRAMLRHALAIPHRNIGLFYSVRTPDEFAYEQELRRLAHAGEIELRQTVTRATDTDWTGPRGRLNREALEELVHDPATLCFICGPPTLVDEMPKILQELGIPRRRIRIEEWGPERTTLRTPSVTLPRELDCARFFGLRPHLRDVTTAAVATSIFVAATCGSFSSTVFTRVVIVASSITPPMARWPERRPIAPPGAPGGAATRGMHSREF